MTAHTIHFTDTETTGLIDKDSGVEIVEIAIVSWTDGATEELLHAYVEPKRGCPPEAAKINRYDPILWRQRGAETWDIDASQEVARLLEGAFMGGSNPGFDQRMIMAECHRTGQPNPNWSHRKLDTSALGYPLWVMDLVPRTGLVALAEYFNIKHEAHTALGDVMASIAVWEAFFDLYVYRPRMMREALEEVKRNTAENLHPKIRAIAERGLFGEDE